MSRPRTNHGFNHFHSARSTATTAIESSGGVYASPAVPQLANGLFTDTDLFGGYVDARLLWTAEEPPSGNLSSPSGTDINNTSVVLSLSWSDRRILLMGDAESYVEERLVEAAQAGELDLRTDGLKVGHHGADSASSSAFLGATRGSAQALTTWAIISSGRKSFSGAQLPTPKTVERLGEFVAPYHLLSTENRDDELWEGEEHNDDHVLVTIGPSGEVRACYIP